MGRKSQSKQNSKNSAKDNNRFLQHKRKELANLVDKLLKLTTIFQATLNLNKTWEHHLEINKIVNEILNLESSIHKCEKSQRQANITKFVSWLNENGAQFEGIEISEFEGYDFGLKATKHFTEDSLILTIPRKVMISEQDARASDLSTFITVDPLTQNMPNVMLALYLLLEKTKIDSFWKPYIDILPDKYSTVLYFTIEELSQLRPSPVFEFSLKLYRSIARQYAYFYNKIYNSDMPVLRTLQNIFTFDNYRWAVSTVMTRQNNLHLSNSDTTAFIPLWDMCNHEHGKITTDFNKQLNQGECFALREFKPGEQIFIFYGARSNADLFLHNGFVYPKNQYDSISLPFGVSSGDPLRETKLTLLSKLGLGSVTHYHLYIGDTPISPELLAFIRIFNMDQDELSKWSTQSLPSELVSMESGDCKAISVGLQMKAYMYLRTRCTLVRTTYDRDAAVLPDSLHSKNIKLLKDCEVQILNGAIKYLDGLIQNLPSADKC